jgi:ADP-ribosyl-[dinitrogen reductase] hydrolase
MPPPAKKKKLAPSPFATPDKQLDRAKGALLGLAVGEALGAPCEGRHLGAAQFPELADGPYVNMLPNGPSERKAGQTGIVTAMAAALAAVLQESSEWDANTFARGYLQLVPLCPMLPYHVIAPLALVVEGRSALFSGRQSYYESPVKPVDALAMARSVPIALALKSDKAARSQACLDDAGITHYAPLARLGGSALCGLIAASIVSPKEVIDFHSSLKALETELSLAAATLGRSEPDVVQQTKDAFDWLRDDVELAQRSDPKLYGPELSLFSVAPTIRVPWRLALWHLFHDSSFESALIDVVNRGGTSGINAAVCGAMLGARFGASAIPERWVESVLRIGHQFEGPQARRFDCSAMLQLAYSVQ